MSTEIIISLITGLCVAIPSIVATVSTSRRNQDLVMYQLNELKTHVEKHNNVIDRMYKIENRVTLIEQKIDKD